MTQHHEVGPLETSSGHLEDGPTFLPVGDDSAAAYPVYAPSAPAVTHWWRT